MPDFIRLLLLTRSGVRRAFFLKNIYIILFLSIYYWLGILLPNGVEILMVSLKPNISSLLKIDLGVEGSLWKALHLYIHASSKITRKITRRTVTTIYLKEDPSCCDNTPLVPSTGTESVKFKSQDYKSAMFLSLILV